MRFLFSIIACSRLLMFQPGGAAARQSRAACRGTYEARGFGLDDGDGASSEGVGGGEGFLSVAFEREKMGMIM